MVFNLLKSDVNFSKAQKLFRQNRPEEAIILYDRVIQLNPKSAGAYLHKAFALAENDSFDTALENIREAIRLKPKNPVYPMFLGMIHYDRHDFDAAVQAFETAATIDPHYEIARVFKGLTDFTTGKMDEAFTRFKGNYNWGLDFQSRLLAVCELYLSQHHSVAISYFQSDLSMASDAGSQPNLFKRGVSNLKFWLLQAMYQLVYLDGPTREMKETYLRGNRFFSLKEFDHALEEYQKIVADGHSRMSSKALQQIVEVFLAKCDFQNALKYINFVEDFQSTLSFLAQLPERPASPSKYPVLNPELILVMGIIHYELGNFEKSTDILGLAAELDPKNYLVYYYLGLANLGRTGNESRSSRNWFKKALGSINEGLLAKRVAETMRVYHRVQNITPVIK